MSSLLQKQFFEFLLQRTEQKLTPHILACIQHSLSDWNIQFQSGSIFQAITTEFCSRTYKNLQYLAKLSLSLNPSSLNVSYFILKNYIPVKIDSKPHKIKLYGFLLRINSSIPLGKFSICPKSGLLIFNAEMLLSQQCLKQLQNPNLRFFENNTEILKKLEDICMNFQVYLRKIFQLVNLSCILYETENQQNSIGNQNQSPYQRQIILLQNLISYTHEDINELIKCGFHSKQRQIKKVSNSILEVCSIFNKDHSQLQNSLIYLMNSDKLDQLIYLSRVNDQKTINSVRIQKVQLLLQKQSVQKVKKIYSNDNCTVDLLSGTKFMPSHDIKHKIRLQFIKKSPLSQKCQKLILRQQKFVNLFMEEGGKEGIAQYFTVNTFANEAHYNGDSTYKVEPLQKNSLFLAFYPNNLSDYISKRSLFLSLNSKLLLLLKIDKALSYLFCKQCEHMDLKPENIMIDINENAKLIDFGQSIHPKLPLSAKPGVSIPYSPPEYFSKYKFTPNRCDAYSLGVIIFEMIFEGIPQKLPSTKEKVVPYYQNLAKYDKLFQYSPQTMEYVIEKKLGHLIADLCFKCMNANDKLRPTQSWIRVYLKKFIQLSNRY